ncbi:hemerythrin family protein [Magnetospira sp. QH-2]|uniref:hemerythrin family protein n=1 Tax=Magnetospira sp. (strain QH-2) TaxID=1288970 RepID=UPI0003E81626|nr:hemerythrin family protein [Magnetospira sp. QH-2]CCQ73018.1 conserved protein of unknown function [hemerythin domain] [Magnetospira sp. QH-2]
MSQNFPQSGNEIIDKHHADLTRLVSKLAHAWIMEQDPNACDAVIDSFLANLDDHFQTEMTIVRAAGFAGWQRHNEDHAHIIRKLRKLADGKGEDYMYRFIDEAERTVFEHELLGDQEYWEVLAQTPTEHLITWDDSLLVHDEIIDEHHKALVNYLNRLYGWIMNGVEEEVFLENFAQIYSFTKVHFEHEESEFATIHSAEAQAHARDHARLLSELRHTIENLRKETDMDDARILMRDFVRFWLIDHILVHDKPFFLHRG